jgi:hypothetical protein
MADVQIQQNPGSGGSNTWLWAIVVLVLIALLAWFVMGRGGSSRGGAATTPAGQTAPAPGGTGGAAGAGGTGGTRTP